MLYKADFSPKRKQTILYTEIFFEKLEKVIEKRFFVMNKRMKL